MLTTSDFFFLPDNLVPGLNRFQAMLDAVLRVGGSEVPHVDEWSSIRTSSCSDLDPGLRIG